MNQDIRVLHVDDDPAVLDLTAEFVERTSPHIRVRSETEPKTVPERLEAEPIDCVVSDYEMPGWNGVELCRRVRTNYPQLPFILFTSRGEDVRDCAMDAGATDYLQKQIGTEQYRALADRIEQATLLTRKHPSD